MGGEAWSYFVPYEKNINTALQKLREQEFKAGRYNKRNVKGKPASIDEVLSCCDAEGSRSILDMMEVIKTPHERPTDEDMGFSLDPDRLARVAPLKSEDVEELFGTDKPNHAQVEKGHDLFEWINRGEGVYLIVYKDAKPHEIYFAGFSFD